MINLLPRIAIEANQQGYRRRRLAVASWLGFGLLAIAAINLWSLLTILEAEKAALADKLASAEKNAEASGITQLEKDALDLRQKIKTLRPGKGETTRISVLFPKIIEHKNPQIRIADLNYGRSPDGEVNINVSGIATDRKGLLDFIDALRQDDSFSAIGSPVSNLIKEREVPFIIELKAHE